MTVYAIPYNDKRDAIDTTSRGPYKKDLSPFYLGPCSLYDGHVSKNVENGWQFSKVYKTFTTDGEPNDVYWYWAQQGWSSSRAYRYPMGKDIKPLYTLWNGKKLDYTQARKIVYVPLYARCVVQTETYKWLKTLHEQGVDIYLRDFDAYDHRKLGYTYQDVIDCPDKKMGHAFVLAMLLEGFLNEGDYR